MTNSSPLTPRLAEIVAYADASRRELVEYVTGLPESVLQQRADADRWSIAEILEHVSMVEDGAGRMLSNLVKQLRQNGSPQDPDTTSVLDCVDDFDVVQNPAKIAAPERVRPSGTVDVPAALERLEASRARLKQLLHDANGLDFSQASAPHPFFGPMNGYQWLVLIMQHELRHLRQMRNTVRDLAS